MNIFLLVLSSLIIIISQFYDFKGSENQTDREKLFIVVLLLMLAPSIILANGFVVYYLLVIMFELNFTFGETVLIAFLLSLLFENKRQKRREK